MQYDSDYEVRLATLAALGGNTGVTYDSVYEIDLEILRLTEQGGGGGGTGTSIDDTVTSTTKTWSSSKINNELAGKQGALTAGDNITITNGVISATGGGADIDDTVTSTTKTWSSSKISGELDGKQETLTAGTNITISNNVISAQQPDLSGYATKDELTGYATVESLTNGLAQKQNTLTAGTNVTIQDGVISATDTTYTAGNGISINNGEISANLTGYATSEDLNNGLSFKQDTLTAGTGINLVNSVISAESEIDDLHAGSATTYSSNKIIELTQGLGFDVEIVQALPQTGDAQTIYMLPKADSAATDVYDEYIYTNNAWEKIGNTQTDLSQYYTKSETDTLLNGKQTTLTAGTGIQIVDNVISATGGGGTALYAGTNISIVDNKINANGYNWTTHTYYKQFKVDYGLNTGTHVLLGFSNSFPYTGSSYTYYNPYGSVAIGVKNTLGYSFNSGSQMSRWSAIAMGYSNYAREKSSVAIGTGCLTDVCGQVSIGAFNATHGSGNDDMKTFESSATTLIAFGAGTCNGLPYTRPDSSNISGISRKNAMEIMRNGDIYVYGAGGYDGKNLSGSTLQQLLAGGGGGGQSLSAGTNISIQNDLINALGYEYDSTLNAVKIGEGLNASGNNSVIVGQYNRSRTTSSGDTIFAIGVGTGTDNANRVNAIETLSNGKTYVNGVGGYTGQGMANTKPLDEVINEISTVANAAATIDDSASSSTNVYSSQKVDQLLSGKQASLTAGNNITISNNTISAAGNVASTSVFTIWSGTQAQYDALSSHSNDVLYLIK